MDSETSQAKRDVLVLLPCLNEFLTLYDLKIYLSVAFRNMKQQSTPY